MRAADPGVADRLARVDQAQAFQLQKSGVRHAQNISDATTNAANARLTAVLEEIWQLRQEANKDRMEAKEDNDKFRDTISKDRKEAKEDNDKF